MIRLVILVGVAVILFVFLRWLFRQPPRVYWQWIGIAVAAALLVMVATGRAHWLAAVFAAMLPFIRALSTVLNNIPLLKRLLDSLGVAQSAAQPNPGQTSSVQSRYIRMTLDHTSGDVNGEVLEGQFKGQELRQLNLEQLLQLLQECQEDEESVSLLQAYLDRVYEDEWHQQAGAQGQYRASTGSGEMSRQEALDILGLSPDASEEEIIKAHRSLIQKLHPDRGGTAYLAAKINQAKETLLGD